MQSIANLELGIPALPPYLKNTTVFKEMTRPPIFSPGSMLRRDGGQILQKRFSGKRPKHQGGPNRQTG